MKKYDRVKKEWVSEEEHERRTKKRDKCKGGHEHDYVEILPWGASANSDYKGDTTPYYEAEKAIEELAKKKEEELLRLGIVTKFGYRTPRDYRRLVCSVCKKQTTKELKQS